MSITARIVLVFLVLRLAVPSGICLCHWTSPAQTIARNLLSSQPSEYASEPVPAPHEHDHKHDHEHEPGCPASASVVALGLLGHSPTLPNSQCWIYVPRTDDSLGYKPEGANQLTQKWGLARPPDDPLFLRLHVLRI